MMPNSRQPSRRSVAIGALVSACGLVLGAGGASAGDGTDVLLVIDPTDPVSLRVGHYYQQARGVPANQVLYMPLRSGNYAGFRQFQLPAVRALLEREDLGNVIDYIVLAPSTSFAEGASGLFSDGCAPVNRLSISSAFSSPYMDDVLGPPVTPVLLQNPYRGPSSSTVVPFDGFQTYQNGAPNANGDRILIGSLLGYTGERGNTVDEILTMIDRSVQADAAAPATGSVYYMRTTDAARSGPRHDAYPTAVSEIQANGGSAEQILANLPIGRHDCMGVMSGFASTSIAGADFTLLPGAFADHLTSFACTFDNSQQTKASEWITMGASGTFGTVEEPCNYPQKFPHARMHVFYNQGLPLGASVLRSLSSFPVQGLLLGDPITSPFDIAPEVGLTAELSGTTLSAMLTASTAKPGISQPVAGLALIDGDIVGAAINNTTSNFATGALGDGWHELTVVVKDNSPVQSTASASVGFVVNTLGRSVELVDAPTDGSIGDEMSIDLRALGSHGASEIRLTQNGRVIASAPGRQARLRFPAQALGQGVSEVQAEAVYADGMVVRSAPHAIDIAGGAPDPTPAAARAFDLSVSLGPGEDLLLSLPFALASELGEADFELLTSPSQAGAVLVGSGVLLSADAGASGLDRLVFRVTGPGGSAEGRVRITYDGAWPDDRNGDQSVDIDDLHALSQSPVDLTGDGVADGADIALLESIVRAELPIDR